MNKNFNEPPSSFDISIGALQLFDLILNMSQTSNDVLLKQLQHQDNDYLEKIVEQNNIIIEKLEELNKKI